MVSLALAIGAAAAAFGVLDAVRFRALPFKDGDRLVLLSELPVSDAPGSPGASGECRAACEVSYETYANLLAAEHFNTLEAIAAFTTGGKALRTDAEPILVFGGVVSPNLFGLLGAAPMLGRALSADDNRLGAPPVVVLSHELWSEHLGQDPAILGKPVKLSDTWYTVIGVMPPGFNHEVRSQFWLPVVPVLDPSTKPSIRSVTVIGRLAPGATLAQARAELATIDPARLQRATQGASVPMRVAVAPLRDRYAASTGAHDLIFAAVVACVLLIACANLANLALVRTLHQQREFAVRSALGALPGRLMQGLFVQYGLVVAVATVLGLGFAWWFLGVLRSLEVLQSLRPSGMEYRLDGRVAVFAALLAAGIGAGLSLIAARVAARADVQRVLRDAAPTATAGRWGSRAQQIFVVAQIACAVVLLTGGGLMARTVLRLSQLDLGFETARVLQGTPSYPHPWRVKEKYLPVTRQILLELGQLPGAELVSLRASTPLGPRGASPELTLEGQAAFLPRGLVPAAAFSVSPGYFRGSGIRVLAGRAFSDQDLETTPPVAVINEWAARHWWPGQDAVGRTFRVDTLPGQSVLITVVGVVRDNKAAQPNLLLAEDGPEIYRPYEQAASAFPTFLVRAAGNPGPLLRPVREALARLVPDRPLDAQLLSQLVDDQLGQVRLTALQIMAFALVGLGLALVGIYGVLSYSVGRRAREIGIRGALGASRGAITAMILGQAAGLTLIGLVIGLAAATAATRLLGGMLYGTSPTDPTVYVAVALAVGLVSLLASYLPARRAARVDPVIALRDS